MDQLKEDIRQYIVSEFLPGEKASNIHDDTVLRSSGLLDSVAILVLVNYIEQRCGIEVTAHETSVENFDSLDAIVQFVQSKGVVS